MKFDQLIEENHTLNVREKLFPDPFLKIKIEHTSGSVV